mmetsp:Transcript_2261/g.5367  ORF Transcript_2261/g.5367 Transcript_2261/m.5367 type:complete len:218 (+) Transcript_2261:293-946(+)
MFRPTLWSRSTSRCVDPDAKSPHWGEAKRHRNCRHLNVAQRRSTSRRHALPGRWLLLERPRVALENRAMEPNCCCLDFGSGRPQSSEDLPASEERPARCGQLVDSLFFAVAKVLFGPRNPPEGGPCLDYWCCCRSREKVWPAGSPRLQQEVARPARSVKLGAGQRPHLRRPETRHLGATWLLGLGSSRPQQSWENLWGTMKLLLEWALPGVRTSNER